MATSSAIVMKTQDGYKGIYCHFDGYPSYVGRILVNSYNTEDKVKELINLGDISQLNDNLSPVGNTHSFDKPEPNVTVAYARDRGEDLKIASSSHLGYLLKEIYHQYFYLFKNGEWLLNGKKKMRVNSDGCTEVLSTDGVWEVSE